VYQNPYSKMFDMPNVAAQPKISWIRFQPF